MFSDFIFDKAEPRRSHIVEEYQRALKNPEYAGDVFNDPTTKDSFELSFDTAAKRTIKFFKVCLEHAEKRSASSSGDWRRFANEISTGFLTSLLDFASDDEHSLIELVELTLKTILPHVDDRSLASVARNLGNRQTVLAALAANETSAGLMQTFARMSLFATPRDSHVCEQWIRTLSAVVSQCSFDHGRETTISRWDRVTKLQRKLHESVRKHETSQSPSVPSPQTMRVFRRDEDNGTTSRTALAGRASPSFELVTGAEVLLRGLGISIPSSVRAVDNIYSLLRTEILPQILSEILETFPCKLCRSNVFSKNALESSDFSTLEIGKEAADAVLGMSALFGRQLGTWRVLVSEAALHKLQVISRTSKDQFREVEKTFQKLASGSWRNRMSEVIGNSEQKRCHKSPLLKAHAGKSLRILWQIDVAYAGEIEEPGWHRQVVKVWQVCERDEVQRHVRQITLFQRLETPCDAFSYQPVKEKNGNYMPVEFPPDERPPDTASIVETATASAYPQGVKPETLELTNRFYAFTESVLQSLLAGRIDAEFPFATSEQEAKIIRHYSGGTLILGRSGTGKTTCLIYQLVNKLLAYKQLGLPIRQILLTRSSYLADKLNSYTQKLIDSQLLNTSPTSELELRNNLDREALENVSTSGPSTLFDFAENDYPYVFTFDRFLEILENTAKWFCFSEGTSSLHMKSSASNRRPQLVNFEIFQAEYWRLFPRCWTRQFTAELVFSEILGVIKGSALVEEELLKVLTREQYLERSTRLAPAYTTDEERSIVYRMYEIYEKRKEELQDKDPIDRIHALSKLFSANKRLDEAMQKVLDEIYIDEIQDQRTSEVLFFLKAIRDPRGIHFAGDTAQCISKDSTFRFQDIKAMFYEAFMPLATKTKTPALARPTLFCLSKNFRSHQGVINLGSAVMNLLYQLFPGTVDKLPAEYGLYDGPCPLVLIGFSVYDLVKATVNAEGGTDVHANAKLENPSYDFGADQVILVRDSHSKEAVEKVIGDKALVLTILDAKGMEFDDVFLFDFFTSIPSPSHIRQLSALLKLGVGETLTSMHLGLCFELKQLYVAITRARNRLWIIESSNETISHFLEILSVNKKGLVTVEEANEDPVAQLKALRPVAVSDPGRHRERGNFLLQSNMPDSALGCFKRAGDDKGVTICKARIAKRAGMGYRTDGNDEGFLSSLQEAVDLFNEVNLKNEVAHCLEEMGRFNEAGDIWKELGSYHNAADLYLRGKKCKEASEAYELCNAYEDAINALRSGELWDEFVVSLDRHFTKIHPKSLVRYQYFCSLLLKLGHVSPEHQDLTITLLGDGANREELMKKFKLHDPLAKIYENEGRHQETFDLYIGEGNLQLALEYADQQRLDIPTSHRQDISDFSACQYAWDLLRSTRSATDRFEIGDLYRSPNSSPWQHIHSMLGKNELDAEIHSSFSNDDGLLHDVYCIFYSLKAERLFGEDKIGPECLRLLVYCLKRALHLLLIAKPEVDGLPQSLALVLGVFNSKKGEDLSSPRFLGYSPLTSELGSVITETKEMITQGCRWIIAKLTYLLPQVDALARDLFKTRWPDVCLMFLENGRCQDCYRDHRNITSNECSEKLDFILETASLICSFSFVYRRRLADEDFRKSFLRRLRFWLERLLESVIFVSSYEQSPKAIRSALDHITRHQDGAQLGMLAELGNLLFIHLKTEWHCNRTFSAFQELLRLAASLDDNVGLPLIRAINYRIRYMSWETRDAAEAAKLLRPGIFMDQSSDMAQILHHFNDAMDIVDNLTLEQFTDFHAVLDTFELYTSFFLCALCPMSGAVLLSDRFIELHLPLFLHSDFLRLQESDQILFREGLFRVVTTCAKLLQEMASSRTVYTFRTQKVPMTGKIEKRTLLRQRVAFLQDRVVNFLIITVTNIASMQLRNGSTVIEEVRKALQPGTLLIDTTQFHHVLMPFNIYTLTNSLQSHFSRYNGKDKPVLLASKLSNSDNVKLADHYMRLKHIGVKIRTLESLRPSLTDATSSTDIGSKAHAGDMKKNASDEAYSKEAEEAAYKIQKFWRTQYKCFLKRRRFLETEEGKATSYVLAVIRAAKSHAGGNDLYDVKSAVLLDQTKVFQDLRALHQLHGQAEHLFNNYLEDPEASALTIELDGIEKISETVDALSASLRTIKRSLSSKHLQEMLVNETLDTAAVKERLQECKHWIKEAVAMAGLSKLKDFLPSESLEMFSLA